MGASNSKLEEDKVLQLCRDRRKFVRKALDGRCSLAVTHVAYIQSLKSTGVALRKFVEPDVQVESSLYTSTSATPEPVASTEKTLSHFSFYSPSASQRVDTNYTFSPTPSPPSSTRIHTNHMRFLGSSSKKVEAKPPIPIIGTVTSSSTTPQNTTPRSNGIPEGSPFDNSLPSGTPPWDFFGLFHPIDNQFSFQEGKVSSQGYENSDDMKRLREEEGIPELEDDEEKVSLHGTEEHQDSEDEFDEPASVSLVRSFENLNRATSMASPGSTVSMASAGSTPLLNRQKSSPVVPSARSEASETQLLSRDNKVEAESVTSVGAETSKREEKESSVENKVAPKDFFSSMKDIEYLFIKASESGKEVPRMLEANKLHFRPIDSGKQGNSAATTFLKACFSCGEDPSQVQEEPAQTDVKYLTWHRTTSSKSSSSRNPLGGNTKDDIEDFTENVFENICMISGSHASTLDRLYAWERKLCDEVKASEVIRREYDIKRKILRQLESNAESSQKVDKTRAAVKDLHSRIRVAIQRIDSISKRIEEIRDKELQPQLEELVEGLSRMWDVMSECHKLQFQIISTALVHHNARISAHSESRRHVILRLEHELNALASTFATWLSAQKSYFEAINDWLTKCAPPDKDKSSKRKRRFPGPALRHFGPPIYIVCGVWLDKIADLITNHAPRVADSAERLALETLVFLPRQEKNGDPAAAAAAAASGEFSVGFDDFRSGLVRFFGELNGFAQGSVRMYSDLDKAIQNAKILYERSQSLPQTRVVS